MGPTKKQYRRRTVAIGLAVAFALGPLSPVSTAMAEDAIRVQLLPIMVKVSPAKSSKKNPSSTGTIGFITVIGHVVSQDRIERFCGFAPSIRDAYNEYFISRKVRTRADGHIILDGMRKDLYRLTTKIIGNKTINNIEVIEGVHSEAGPLSSRFSHLQGCRVIG